MKKFKNKTDIQDALFIELKKTRFMIAFGVGLPVERIFRDQVLLEMSELQPASELEMQQILGVGPTKFRMYGEPFLSILKKFKNSIQSAS